MTGRRSVRDDGAILILVLVIVTILGAAAAALVQLGYTTPQAQRAYAADERLVNALDAGTAAAVEDVRVAHTTVCPAGPLLVSDADGLGDGPAGPLDVDVSCATGATNQLVFTATGYLAQPKPDTGCGSPLSKSLGRAMTTTVAFFPRSAPSPTTARIVSRRLAPPCQDHP